MFLWSASKRAAAPRLDTMNIQPRHEFDQTHRRARMAQHSILTDGLCRDGTLSGAGGIHLFAQSFSHVRSHAAIHLLIAWDAGSFHSSAGDDAAGGRGVADRDL